MREPVREPQPEAAAIVVPAGALDPIVEVVLHRVATRLQDVECVRSTPWMTLAETCEYLRWSKDRVYKLTSARAIPHIKHEGRLLFNRPELDLSLAAYHEGPHHP
jgi:excisionase family DNA binding protein